MSEGEPASHDNRQDGDDIDTSRHMPNASDEYLSDGVESGSVTEQKDRAIVEEFANFLTLQEMDEYAGEDRETVVSYIFDKALGQTVVDAIPDEMWTRICAKSKSSEAIWEVIRKMKASNRGVVIEQDASRREKVIKMFTKTETSAEQLDSAPVGLPTTEQAVEASREKSIMRRMAMKVVGGAEALKWAAGSPIAATKHMAYKFLTLSNERQEKWNEKFRNMSPEEQRKYEKRAARNTTIAALGAGLIYLAYRTHGFGVLDGSHDVRQPENGSGVDGDHSDIPEVAPSGGHDFVYDPKLDPARDPAKHHNDWGTMLQASPEDGDKPAGYADFFNNRLKHSPEELSATLSEFGLNSKDSRAINDLADQMARDPKLFEQNITS